MASSSKTVSETSDHKKDKHRISKKTHKSESKHKSRNGGKVKDDAAFSLLAQDNSVDPKLSLLFASKVCIRVSSVRGPPPF